MKKLIKKILASIGYKLERLDPTPEIDFESGKTFLDQYYLAQKCTQSIETDNRLRRERHHTLYHLLRQVNVLSADVAECGCFRGLSAYQIASLLKAKRFNGTFYIFDSFEGLSEYSTEDFSNGKIREDTDRRKYFACDEGIVRANLKGFDFISYMKGWIPARFLEVAQRKFSFVHIDVDLYSPIKESLGFFYSRMTSGGIIAFDDYGCLAFPGAKKAVDEFMFGKSDFFLPLPSGEAFLIKS